MRIDETALGPAVPPAGRRFPAAPPGFGPRVLTWALHQPLWSYVALAFAGLAAALLAAALVG